MSDGETEEADYNRASLVGRPPLVGWATEAAHTRATHLHT